MKSLGINIGSSSLKIVCLENEMISWSQVIPHEGDFTGALLHLLNEQNVEPGIPTMVTGTEGRFLFNLAGEIEPVCIETALKALDIKADAIASMGGEDLAVYALGEQGRIVNSFSGSKCASGTGEFFKQQLGRMDMTLDDIDTISSDQNIVPLASRCSVFMKSDCTHRLNKHEATKEEIVLSLCSVMATRVVDFLKKTHSDKGSVLLLGGMTRNRHLLKFIDDMSPDMTCIVPESAPYFEAYGAALLARTRGTALPDFDRIISDNNIKFERYNNLKEWEKRVKYLDFTETELREGGDYILGVDGGSTTTKACLIERETGKIAASHYGRTHGDPVKALKLCLAEIITTVKHQLGPSGRIRISLSATTGSSREILGVFLKTQGVYNEIIAHSVGTTSFAPDVDTIFEIGGQDAKYVLLKNMVPIDYAMNEACSAGTGSFLEESAHGDLNIPDARDIGPIAMNADHPLKFGEHCSAFINSDIRKAIQQGASREDITAGIVTSIVSNYLNRVVGNRTIGKHIFLQGGVAKNPAVAPAFAMLLKKDILVPPAPELMGCYGVGILAERKFKDGLLDEQSSDLEELMNRQIIYDRVFKCRSCDNYCPIQVLKVDGQTYMFGGRCNKYANSRNKIGHKSEIRDYTEDRNRLMFETCAPHSEEFNQKKEYKVGIPMAFSVYTLYPLYSWFFHELGIPVVVSDKIEHEGIARAESTYCFPAEIAHGAVQDILNKNCDFIFVPHFRDMPSSQTDVHANFCPITQSLPYYIRRAFPHVDENRLLPLVVSFKFGEEKALEHFMKLAPKLDIEERDIEKAFYKALEKQKAFDKAAYDLGKQALEEAKMAERPVIALMGRPYNAFAQEANMGIPRKYTSRGCSVIPFDILPVGDEEITPNMYWYYGQLNMKAASMVKDNPDIYVTYISNFSCAPDSFLLHFIKWMMGTKPYLVLELDSHSADAGIDTRIEAFLDIIEGYKQKKEEAEGHPYDNGLRFMNEQGRDLYVKNVHTGEETEIRNNPKVKILLSNMGDLGTRLLAASMRSIDITTEAMPVSNRETLELARSLASGKECVPSHLVLGSALKYFASDSYREDETYLLFVPITTGPCRTGQYFVFFRNLFRDLRLKNVVVITLSADNSYTELGSKFSRYAWWALAISDYMKDIQTTLRATAKNREEALKIFTDQWEGLIEQAEVDITKVMPQLKQVGRNLASLPLQTDPMKAPRILVVGEIFVRRDDFAVDELIELLSIEGIIGKVSGMCEWIHYLDFVRIYDLNKRLKLMPAWKRPFSSEMRRKVIVWIEGAWKHSKEHHIREALAVSGLVPPSPHNMKSMMDYTQRFFVNHELNSEIAISSGAAASSMDEGYSGVINISPFACLIGRVIEGLFVPWARDRQYPALSLEVDGNQLPPGIISKLNIFMLNVKRFRKDSEAQAEWEQETVADTEH